MKTLLLALTLSLIIASCDSPKEEKKSKPATTENSDSPEGTEDKKKRDVEEPIIPAGTTLKFTNDTDTLTFKAPFTATHKQKLNVTEVKEDKGVITYALDNTAIATVDETTGVVSPQNVGEVIITATKAATANKYKQSTARYTLTIAKYKPANKNALVAEIQKATKPEVRGMRANLNYIDTSAIKDMSYLFSSDKTNGHGLHAFAGDISKWNVLRVTTMQAMFSGATKFNSDISRWNVSSVTNMHNMFVNAMLFNKDISGWNVLNVTIMHNMFVNATAFKQNLNAWGSKLNEKIKANNWLKAASMFANSGLKDSLPNWCEEAEKCKKNQK